MFRPNDPKPLPSGDGTRRYLCVEVTGKVDMSGQIPYKQMFAQAVAELRNPDCIYWFTSDDEREIQQHNSQYQQESAPELVLSQLFEPAAQHSRDNFWTTTAIQKELENHLKAADVPNLTNLGLLDPALAASEFQPELPRRSSVGSLGRSL